MADSNADLFCFDPANLCWIAGNDETIIIEWKDENGSAVVITGASAVFQMRRSVYDDYDLQLAGTIDGPNGKVTITATDVETAALLPVADQPGVLDFLWDLRLTLNDGTVKTIAGGTITVKEGITK